MTFTIFFTVFTVLFVILVLMLIPFIHEVNGSDLGMILKGIFISISLVWIITLILYIMFLCGVIR